MSSRIGNISKFNVYYIENSQSEKRVEFLKKDSKYMEIDRHNVYHGGILNNGKKIEYIVFLSKQEAKECLENGGVGEGDYVIKEEEWVFHLQHGLSNDAHL